MKKLFRKAPCGHKVGIGCIGCRGTGEVYVEVDPADLELAVWGAWEELKKHIVRGKENCDRANEPCVYSLYAVVETIIADLESALDPKKLRAMREIREKAAAWDKALGCAPAREAYAMRKFLEEAQADLKTPDKPFAKAQDKPDYEAMCREILGLGLCESCQKIIDSCWQDHSELLEINPSASGGQRTADEQRQEHTPQAKPKPEGKDGPV